MNETKLIQSTDLAYWLGVMHSDGNFNRFISDNFVRYKIQLNVSKKSMPMMIKFKEISERLFQRKSKIFRIKNGFYKLYNFHIGVTEILNQMKELNVGLNNPPTPPNWITINKKFFGAYLAGLLDGDGTVRVKRKKYPQFGIRICGDKKQKFLGNLVSRHLKCNTWFELQHSHAFLNGRKINGKGYALEFHLSSKNYKFIENFVIPHMSLTYKINKMKEFILNNTEKWARGDLNPN